MEDNNYQVLLDKLNELSNRMDKYDQSLEEVTEFNRTLLNSKEPLSPNVDKDKRKEELGKKLKEGLRHA